MKSVNIQFHMLPDELLAFVDEVRQKHALDVEIEAWTPRKSRIVGPGESLTTASAKFGVIDRYWLIVRSKDTTPVDKLMLNASTSRGTRLSQADFGAGAASPEGKKILQSIAADLCDRTLPGVWVVSDFGGKAAFAKSFRISERAATESRSGNVELCGIGFVQKFYPDEPVA